MLNVRQSNIKRPIKTIDSPTEHSTEEKALTAHSKQYSGQSKLNGAPDEL